MANNRHLTQRQFGRSASAYLASEVHAKGVSLDRLVELVAPQISWLVLDVASGVGHTAMKLAPLVKRVVSTDLTLDMLTAGKTLAESLGFENNLMSVGDAASQPFAGSLFDLITCRLAAHHFSSIQEFVYESYRLLKPGGILAVVDNVVPGRSGNRRDEQQAMLAGRYINAFEKMRDPSHGKAFDERSWTELFFQNDFRILHKETITKRLNFEDWVKRMHVLEPDVTRLRAMMHQAPRLVEEYFRPEYEGDWLASFSLTELIILGRK